MCKPPQPLIQMYRILSPLAIVLYSCIQSHVLNHKFWKKGGRNGAVEREKPVKALAAAKNRGVNWRQTLEKYVHVYNKVKPHSRLRFTPFELLVGWKHRHSFPALWDSKREKTARETFCERDAITNRSDYCHPVVSSWKKHFEEFLER